MTPLCLLAGLGILAAGQFGHLTGVAERDATQATPGAADAPTMRTAAHAVSVDSSRTTDGSSHESLHIATPVFATAVRSAQITTDRDASVGPPAADSRDGESGEHEVPVSPHSKMSGPVAALAAAGGNGLVQIIARYDEHPQLFDDQYVADLGGTVTRRYETLDMRAITIPASSLEALAIDENVDWLSLDDELKSTSVASRVAANLPDTGSINMGIDGSGIGVAVLDTGVSQHADLPGNIRQYSFLNGAYPMPTIVNGQIAAYNDNPREDLFGHGTHVAGIVSGSGSLSNGNFEGSAQGASVLSLQVLDGNGAGSMSDVMAALDWLSVYGSYFNIRVVNLSLGKGISESNTTDPLVLAVENLWDAGIVVIVAAGNNGYAGGVTITSPGNSRKVITVGSLTDNASGADFTDDYVSSFSSRGPTTGDLVMKPDLVAPGNRIVAAVPQNALLVTLLPGRVVGCVSVLVVNTCSDVYLEMSGTSMATPMVAAAVARMLDKDPTLTPATIKARLMRSARKISADATTAGAGVLDVDAALNDSGVVIGQALSPLMVFDAASNGVLVEDTAALWGDATWGASYLFSGGETWAQGYGWTDGSVNANGYVWTNSTVWAEGYGWTDGTVSAKGYGWTDGVLAKSLLEDDGSGTVINDDVPAP